MKIAIIGCGAMGSVYAGLLASCGHDVIVIDRWLEHIDAINQRGLRVEGASGDRIARVRAYTDPPDEPVDLIIIAVKAAQAGAAAQHARCLLGGTTVVLTIQNGLGSAQDVAAAVGEDRLAVGIAAAFGASLPEAGHAHHNGMAAVRMGAYGSLAAGRLEAVAAAWRDAGFNAETVPNVAGMQWEKLICNVAYSAPCALTVAIDVPDPVAHVRAFAARIPDAKPSVLLDLERGRKSEVDFINGAIPREALKCGRRAPVNEVLTALVLQREGAPRA
jgi:2-dehydropantoate 2-reductase